MLTGMLRKAREAYRTVRILWLVHLIKVGPLGRTLYGCLALAGVLHVPLLVAGIVTLTAQEQGAVAPAWTKGVFGFYVIVWAAFLAVSRGLGDADPSPPVIDEPVIQMVYQMQDQPMSEEEVEQLAGAATAVMDYGMTGMDAAVDIAERRGKRRRVGGDEEE